MAPSFPVPGHSYRPRFEDGPDRNKRFIRDGSVPFPYPAHYCLFLCLGTSGFSNIVFPTLCREALSMRLLGEENGVQIDLSQSL